MRDPYEIHFIDRETKKIKKEKVYGQWFLDLIYSNFFGRKLRFLFTNRLFSSFYGFFQNLPLSQIKYETFINKYNINMEEFKLDQPNDKVPYKTFNHFFIRKFKEGKRPFALGPHILPAFAEGRYLVYPEINDSIHFPIKGTYLKASDFLGQYNSWGHYFQNGSLIITRLCPVDYHRFHFPDDGKIIKSYRVSGPLHSVNPIGIQHNQKLYLKNERHVNLLETKNFGKMAFIEVGAICVGKIIQTKKESEFKKGEEKGYFLFGGSSLLVFLEKNQVIFDQDIIQNTHNQKETYIKLGSKMGSLYQLKGNTYP